MGAEGGVVVEVNGIESEFALEAESMVEVGGGERECSMVLLI